MKNTKSSSRKVIRLVNTIELQITGLFKKDILDFSEPSVRFLNKITQARQGEGPMIA